MRRLVDDPPWLERCAAGSADPDRAAPAVGTEGPPSRIRAGKVTDAGDELAIRQWWRRLRRQVPGPAVAFVVLAQVSLESLPNGSRPEDQEVVIRRHAVGDLSDESVQVLEPARFASRLGGTSAAVPDAGLVADVAGRPAVWRHIRYEVLDIRGVVLPADDDREA